MRLNHVMIASCFAGIATVGVAHQLHRLSFNETFGSIMVLCLLLHFSAKRYARGNRSAPQ